MVRRSATCWVASAVAAYLVSFVGVGTYWNNHHHLLKLVRHVDGRMLWANLAFLFVLSFFPLATDWMQKTSFAPLPTTCYVVLNMLVSLTYMNLERVIRHAMGRDCGATPKEELARRAVVEKRSLLKERLTLVFELVGLVGAGAAQVAPRPRGADRRICLLDRARPAHRAPARLPG